MKSFKDITWLVDEPTYRADPALSYSTLSKYERGGKFNSLTTLFDKESTPSLAFGSLVDTMITGSEDDVREMFVVVQDPGISETLKTITEILYEQYKGSDIHFTDIPDSIIAQVGKDCDYYASDKYEYTRVKKIRESCYPYYSTLILADSKIPVTSEDVEDARNCVHALKTNAFTKACFESDPFNTATEVFYQLKFRGQDPSTGVEYRSMADLITVNHANKTVQPWDLKTSSHNEWDFPKSFIKYRYDLQARLYYRNIKQTMLKDDEYKNYKLLPYKFIVVNRKNCLPMVWGFSFTESYGTLSIPTKAGDNIILRDPYTIGAEVDYYMKNQPLYPMGVKEVNDIVEYIRDN